MTTTARYALVLGSGFRLPFGDSAGHTVETRFGSPSGDVHRGNLQGHSVLTLARHGDDHSVPPHAVNYRANLAALQQLGADSIIALNTVGAVSNVCQCGEIAVPRQILDYTWGREHTIFDGKDGVVEHIDFTEPFSTDLRSAVLQAARAVGLNCHDGGVYAATQGPRLESAAEVDRLERDGADFVGMTAMPEASIARELGLRYVCLALIVNQAAGRGDSPIHEDVESHSLTARTRAMDLLMQFFKQA